MRKLCTLNYTLLLIGVSLFASSVTRAQCGFNNRQENGNTYYPRTTNQTMGIGPTAYARFEVKNTASYIWNVCGFSVYDTQLMGYPASNTGAANWYNDDYCEGYGGNIRSSSSEYLGVNGWPSTFNGQEYVQINPFNCAGWANYGSATLNYRCVAPASPTVATPGNGTWNIYCYDAGDAAGGNGAWTNNYSGYYTENNLNFDTQNRWGTNNTPYDANANSGSAYQGCYILPDNHSWRAVRTNIPCGVYQVQVTHDDIGQIIVNGTTFYNNPSCCASTNAGTFVIHPSDVVEYRVSEGGGGSNGLITFNNAATTLNGGSISYAGSTSACANYDPPVLSNAGPAFGGASDTIRNGSSAYQWQVNGGNIGGATARSYDPGPLAAGTYVYRRQVTDRCGNVAYSNTITITVTAAPALGTLSNAGPINFCDAAGNFGTGLSVSGQTGTVNWEWGSSDGVWHAWTTGTTSPTATFPKKVAAMDNNADRIRYYTSQAGCPNSGYSSTVLINNRYNEAPTSLSASQTAFCIGAVPSITLTATFPSATNILGSVEFFSGSCGGTSVASVAGNGTTTVSTVVAAPSANTDYFVRYNPGTGSGCSPTACQSVSVTVYPAATAPTLNARTPNTASVCPGTDVSATVNAGSGGGTTASDIYEYSINNGGTWATYVPGNPINTVSATGSVQIRAGRTGCSPTGNTVISTWTIDAQPGAVTVNSSGTYCNNTTLNATGGSGGTIYYQGNVSGGTSTATPSASQTVSVSGTYYFRAQSAAGCWGPEGIATVVIQPLITYYADADGDGFGDPAVTTQACSTPAGYVTDNTDCDDTRNTVYPGAPEICDGLDNNCNGSTDEGVLNTYYADADGDGYGDPAVSAQACTAPVGYVSDNTDCDDTRNTVYPGAPEICDGLDNNCNGSTDEGVLNTYYADTDGDGYGDPAVSTQACTAPVGYVSNNTDCDDTNNSIYPGAFEICGNGIDEDCDGSDAICAGLVWNGSTGTDWATAANWTPNGIPNNCASDISIPLVANQPAITGADYSVGSMTVADGVIISVQNGFRLNVCGNVNISGSTGLDVNGGQLFFVGSTPQTVTGVLTADAATLNNTAGLTLAAAGSFSVVRSVSLQNGTLTSNDNLTLLSDATGTAYLDDFSTGFAGNVSGNINVQRYNPLGLAGFRQLGTPVQLPNISAVSNFTPSGTAGFVIPVPTCDPNYVAFNSPYGNWMQLVENGTVQYACHQSLFEVLTSGGMTSGRGYYLDVPGNSTLTFTGAPTTGSVSFGLTHANTAVTNGWNMVSNPYPSPLAWETANVPAGVDGIGKIWVTSGAYTGTFQDIDPNVPGTAVAIGQAFQVRVSTPGASVPFTVDNSDRTTAPPTYLFAGGPGMVLNIDILGNGFADLTKVRFIDGATPAMDAMFDSPKMLGNANQPMVYSVWNGKNYSTNSYAELNQVYTLPLGTKLATAGQYTLAFSNADQFPGSAFIYLEDTETQTWQDIRLNDTYVFTQNEGVNENRFLLHFYPPLQQQVTDASCTQPGRVVLTEEAPAAWNYRLADNQGTTVSQGTLDGSQTIDGLPAGQYVLSLTEQTSGYTTTEIVHVTGEVAITAQASVSSLTAETGQSLQFNAQTQGADAWHWDFGDSQTATEQNPVHAYNAGGTYHVILMASNTDCEVTSNLTVNVISTASIQDDWKDAGVKMWNDGNIVYLTFGETWAGKSVFSLYDMQGRKIYQHRLNDASGTLSIDCGVLAAGTYTAELSGNGKFLTRKTAMGIK